jgi:predicted RNase H-like HicB family nuclease
MTKKHDFFCPSVTLRRHIEKDGKAWHAWTPDLKGCHTSGETKTEAELNLFNAAEAYLKSLIKTDQFCMRSYEKRKKARNKKE